MSTQHRPTFHAAVGRTESGPSVRTFHFSSKDQAAHTKMKYRVSGQASSSDMINRDLVAELERREREFVAEKTKHLCAIEAEEKAVDTKLLMIAAAESIVPATAPVKVYDDADAEGSADGFDSSRFFLLRCGYSYSNVNGCLLCLLVTRATTTMRMMSLNCSVNWSKSKETERQ